MNIHSIISNTCNSRIKYGIVSMCLKHGKGGYSDRNGNVQNCRGGSKGTESVNRYCTATHKKQEASGYQGWSTVSYFGRGLRALQGHSTNRQNRGKLNFKLASASSTKNDTCNCRGGKWHSLADTAFCYSITECKGLVGGHYFMDDWNDWYAERATVRMPAITLPQDKSPTATGFIREIVRRYAAQDHVSEQDYLDMLILKDQHERRDRALLD
jgi:hypothetical protein